MSLDLRTSVATLVFLVGCCATSSVGATSPAPLFASDAVLAVTIKAPFAALSRGVRDKSVPAILSVGGAAQESLPIALSPRGTTRRQGDICSFPPLRVEFTAKPASTSMFNGQKTLKLVTHCQQDDDYQQYVLLEYVAYRLYGALTPQSFHVRLATIEYVRPDGRSLIRRFGFFIEDVDDVAKRNGMKRLRGVNRISPTQLEPAAAARFAMFEYMIGNLDWAMTAGPAGEDCCHNARLIGIKDSTTQLIPVPYDFDFAGLIDAPYAVPPAEMNVPSVRTRLYRGLCLHAEAARAAAADILAQRASLLTIVDATPELSVAARRRASNYLGRFFEQIGSPVGIAKLLKSCRRQT